MIRKEKPGTILEIGGGTGALEKVYNSITGDKVDEWIIIDPEPNPIETNAKFIRGFFPNALPKGIKFDLLVHSHVWEHAYSPRDFLSTIVKILPIGGKMIFSVPNLRYLLEEAVTSILNFEHTVYLSDYYVDYLLSEFGFEIEEKKFFENHSVMYSTIKTGIQKRYVDKLSGLYELNKSLFKQYVDRHESRMRLLNSKITGLSEKCYLFGGHITTQFYLAFGLDASNIRGVLDNDKFKHGRRVGGTKWVVQSPLLLRDLACPEVILPSSPYTEEIKKQIIASINPNTRFMEIDRL